MYRHYLHKALQDKGEWVRYMAAGALGNIGDLRSLAHLVKLLEDDDQDVRFATAHALGTIGHPLASEALKQICEHDNCFVKIAAEEALQKLEKSEKSTPGEKAEDPVAGKEKKG